MEILKNNLTQYGQDTVERDLKSAEENINALSKKLEDAKKYHEKMLIAKDCIHEFEPNQTNGMQLIVSTCVKCGYSWYD